MDALREENRGGRAATRLLAVGCGDEAFEHLRALCAGGRQHSARQDLCLERAAPDEARRILTAVREPLAHDGEAEGDFEAQGSRRANGPIVCVLGSACCTRDEAGRRGHESQGDLDWMLSFVSEASAAGAAVIVLAEEECPEDDRALMEAGAVDYLVRSHINGPLFERALRYAAERKRVESALSSSEERFRALAESSSIVIATLDHNGTIRYVNAAARGVFGYEPAELVGTSFAWLLRSARGLSPEKLDEHLKYLREHQDTSGEEGGEENGRLSLQVEGVRRDGSVAPLDITLGEFRTDGDRFFSVLVRDLSRRRAAEEALRQSEERVSRLAANLPGVVYQWRLDVDGRAFFTFLSEGSLELLGRAHTELLNQDARLFIEEAMHPDDREAFWESVRASARSLSPWQWLGRFYRLNPNAGSEREEVWLDCRARPSLQDDGGVVWDGMMLDVSTQMRVEDELRQARSELEARVQRRTRQLAKANHTLQAEVAERTRAEANVRARARQQEAVAELSQSALRGIELPILLRGGASLAAATLDVEVAAILHLQPGVTNQEGVAEALAYTVGFAGAPPEARYVIQEQSLLRRVIEEQAVVTVDDWDATPEWKPPILSEAGISSSLYVPIPGEATPLGALCLHSIERRLFSAEDVQFAQALASVVATAIDRNRLEAALGQSRSRLQAVLDNTENLIYIKDRDGRYVLSNKSFERLHDEMFPHAPPLLGSLDRDFLAPQDAQALTAHDAQVLESGQSHTFEEIVEHAGGRKYFLSAKFPLLGEDGAPIAVGGISADITERKRLELAGQAAREEAERAREEADRANQAKSEFLSRMSHELRTPLNAILGFAQLLEIARLPDRSQQGVSQILKAGRHLLALINEVLDIARIESGRLTTSIEPVPLRRVVEEVVGLITPLAHERGVRLIGPSSTSGAPSTWECEASVMADRQRLIQVLLNLTSNAVKYNREGGSVRVWCEDAGPGRVRVLVADDGAGIAPGKLERLWVPFDRLDAEKSGVEGTGLGLALSRALAESMNGSLHVASREGEGSTFWIELEAAARVSPSLSALEAGAPGEGPGESEGIGGTILYIEDNPSNVLLVEELVRHRPRLRLVTARTGGEGLEIARSIAPDVILLDLDLPDLHGLSVLEKLRLDPRTRSTPVVIVSADATRSQIARLKAAGAFDYITKPLDVARLLALLDQVLVP